MRIVNVGKADLMQQSPEDRAKTEEHYKSRLQKRGSWYAFGGMKFTEGHWAIADFRERTGTTPKQFRQRFHAKRPT